MAPARMFSFIDIPRAIYMAGALDGERANPYLNTSPRKAQRVEAEW